MLKIDIIPFNFVRVNTYIFKAPSGNCVIVDPGCLGESEESYLSKYLSENSLTPVGLWLTHQHFDHVFGVSYVERKYGLKALCMRGDESWQTLNVQECEKFRCYMSGDVELNFTYSIGRYVEEGEELVLDDYRFRALHVPGHSQGSMVLYCEAEKVCIAGDVLFQMSIGRSDFPGGNERQLIENIRAKMLTLPDDTVVLPGHGSSTTIEIERKANPFLVRL